MDEAAACVSLPTSKRKAPTDMQKAELACRKVQLGEVSRGRHCLTGSPLAPGTEDTWKELQSKRPSKLPESCHSGFSSSIRTHPWHWIAMLSYEVSKLCLEVRHRVLEGVHTST